MAAASCCLRSLFAYRDGSLHITNFSVLNGNILRTRHGIDIRSRARCASPFGLIANRTDITWTPIKNNDVSWNFSKWLIAHDGYPYRRYTPRTEPDLIKDDIEDLIETCEKEKKLDKDKDTEKLFEEAKQKAMKMKEKPKRALFRY